MSNVRTPTVLVQSFRIKQASECKQVLQWPKIKTTLQNRLGLKLMKSVKMQVLWLSHYPNLPDAD